MRLAGRRRVAGLAVAVLLACAGAARADTVVVAVASNFAPTLAALAPAFSAASGHALKLSSGSSGKFATQIAAGAPFDVLLSADAATPARLLQEGHGVAGSAFSYASGRLVLWSRQAGLVDADGAVLASARFRFLAIANPRLAPYGLAAQQVLAARGLLPVLEGRIVSAESVAQAFQFAATGQADLAFVAWSQVKSLGGAGSHWLVPEALHAPLRQDALLLRSAADKPAARALLAWLQGPVARDIIAGAGYDLPPSASSR